MNPPSNYEALRADINALDEKIDLSFQELKDDIQALALSQKELSTSYTFIAEMAKTHSKALYGSNGDTGCLASCEAAQRMTLHHDVQLNGTPGKEEESYTAVIRSIKEKADTLTKIVWIAIGTALATGVTAVVEAILRK